MSKKPILLGLYLVITVLVWIYQIWWGPMASASAMHNLGRALMWPFMLFPALGNVVGSIILLLIIVAFVAL